MHLGRLPKTVRECTVESHESTKKRMELFQLKINENHIASNGFYFDVTFQFGGQVSSDAPSDENSAWKSLSGSRLEQAPDDPTME